MKEPKKGQENRKRRRKSMITRRSSTAKGGSCLKENSDRQEQEVMEVELYVDQKEKSCMSEKTKEPDTDKCQASVCNNLMANNRALAAALEDAQLELRSVYHENVQLKKQIHESHHKFVEKSSELEKQLRSLEQLSGNHVPKSAQVVFHDVYNLLSQTCAQFLQGSNFLSDALHLVRSLLTPADGPLILQSAKTHLSPHVMINSVSPYVDPLANAVCTTPPPDEPSAMEITASQSVVIETYDTAVEPLVREQGNITADTAAMDIDQSQLNGRRAKRKSCLGVSYTEPKLHSKLRRGDPFTDSSLFGDESLTNTRKKKKTQLKRATSLPVMVPTKKRAPLTNLTNVIAEEC